MWKLILSHGGLLDTMLLDYWPNTKGSTTPVTFTGIKYQECDASHMYATEEGVLALRKLYDCSANRFIIGENLWSKP